MNPGNNNNFFGQIVSQQGINVNNATANQLIYSNNYSTTLYYNSTGIPTVLLGLRAANANNEIGISQQGLYVSEPGIDVTQATNNQLIFNSSQNILTIYEQGTAQTILGTPVSTYQSTITIPHNLGYIPAALVYGAINNNFSNNSSPPYVENTYLALPITFFIYQFSTFSPLLSLNFSTDNNNLYIQTALIEEFANVNYVFTYQYYILADSITP